MLACIIVTLVTQEPPTAGYDGGFFVRTRDVKLTVEGLLQVDYRLFERDSPYASEFVLRRMRLEFSGEFFERWLFHIEPKFTADGVELEEAWVGVQLGDHRVMIGRMKEPFSLEEMSSTRHMDMLNFSILNQFVPSEDHGVTVFGRVGIVEYGAGFYNGTGGDDTTSDKDVAVRIVVHPWYGLQFGGAATFGRQRTDVSGGELRTEARVPFAEVHAGTEIDDARLRLGVEAAYVGGPFAVTAEVVRIREKIGGETVTLTGGYLQASWVVTGEEKTWKGVSPAHPFLKEPAAGAWQIMARWSRLALDDELAPFLTAFPERIDSFTAGVTWYANDFVKVKINALRTRFAVGETVDAVLFQVQAMF